MGVDLRAGFIGQSRAVEIKVEDRSHRSRSRFGLSLARSSFRLRLLLRGLLSCSFLSCLLGSSSGCLLLLVSLLEQAAKTSAAKTIPSHFV